MLLQPDYKYKSLKDCLSLYKVDRTCHLVGNEVASVYKSVFGTDPTQAQIDSLTQSTKLPTGQAFIDASVGDATNYLKSTPDYQNLQVTNQQNATQQAQQALLDKNAATQNQFTSDFTNFTKSLPTASDIYQSASAQLGIKPLQDAASSLETTLANIPTQGAQRAQQLGLTSGQMNEYNASQASALAPTVTAAENALGARENDLNTLVSGSLAQQQTQLLPWQTQASFIGQNAAAAVSLFSQGEQETWNTLMNKIQNDQALNMAEVQQTYALAQKAQAFQQQLQTYNTPIVPGTIGAQQYPYYTNPSFSNTSGNAGSQYISTTNNNPWLMQ